MECPKCQYKNREGAKFCRECGEKLELECPQCGKTFPLSAKFCDECGQRLTAIEVPESRVLEAEGARKYVTVLFSDLSGYTAMAEKFDPEELKEIMSRIFGEMAQVVTKYEGFIEKFVGDAVMALFGVPKAHEDDPVRAIKVAREIHELISGLSHEVEKRIGKPIWMHTGINTGLVVTGEVNTEKGTHGLAGETINVASRLSSLAKPGEILVGHDTCRQAEGHFTFEDLGPTTLKGMTEPIQVHKVITSKDRPITVHRLSGLKAELIGRKAELTLLRDAVENLPKGRGSIFSICGDAGTGKSRLVEEFKNSLDFTRIQWVEGHAYAYAQNIPYFPLIDLLNRVLHIEENDTPENVRKKIESGVRLFVGKEESVVPFVGSLYSLRYPEIEAVSPEFWKSHLQNAIRAILSGLAKKAPTIFFLEDLHWADPSFVELLRGALKEIQEPAVVICAYRPAFSLFTGQQIGSIGKVYQEIRLQNLSLSETENMLESLLTAESIPSDLKRFVQDKAEGNPFYLEELINSLIESEALVRDNGSWKITGTITESAISPTIHGLISGRLDRVEKETKRILQEASVIGRVFLYDILKRITELDVRLDLGLNTLERLDFIRTRSLQPELEYMFKHPLTQEVVYNGILRKERREIHEQIAIVMEQLFNDRLPEFYETLAFHFQKGRSVLKAVDYLMKSGEKSLRRLAVEESNQYYQEAYNLLKGQSSQTKAEMELLIDVLIEWSLVFYYRGDFRSATKLLTEHEGLAESLNDKYRLGMFYGWLGMTMWARERFRNSYEYLNKALEIGEQINDEQVIGYACTWLIWTYAELGMHEEALVAGKRAQEISKSLTSDHYLFLKSLSGIGYLFWIKGQGQKCIEAGLRLVDFGLKHSSIRSQVMGHYIKGLGYFAKGDFQEAKNCFTSATEVSGDPYYYHIPRLLLGMTYILTGGLQEAETILREVVEYSEKFDTESIGTPACAMLGGTLLLKGELKTGLKMVEDALRLFHKNERIFSCIMTDYILGTFYLQIANKNDQFSLPVKIKNIGFLVKHTPFSSQKAEAHFNKAIELADQTGAKGLLGQAYMGLGLLEKARKRNADAREYISKAIMIFEECEAEVYLKHATEALASLG
jgi:class 3 adenylate cyclase/tetratricopeptide (TPR) repeat protein